MEGVDFLADGFKVLAESFDAATLVFDAGEQGGGCDGVVPAGGELGDFAAEAASQSAAEGPEQDETPEEEPEAGLDVEVESEDRPGLWGKPRVVEEVLAESEEKQGDHHAEADFVSRAGEPAGMSSGDASNERFEIGGGTDDEGVGGGFGLGEGGADVSVGGGEAGVGTESGLAGVTFNDEGGFAEFGGFPTAGSDAIDVFGCIAVFLTASPGSGAFEGAPEGDLGWRSGAEEERSGEEASDALIDSEDEGEGAETPARGDLAEEAVFPLSPVGEEFGLHSPGELFGEEGTLFVDGGEGFFDLRQGLVDSGLAGIERAGNEVEEVRAADSVSGGTGHLTGEEIEKIGKFAARLEVCLSVGEGAEGIDAEDVRRWGGESLGIAEKTPDPFLPVGADVGVAVGVGLDED